MQIMGLFGMYFDAVLVKVKKNYSDCLDASTSTTLKCSIYYFFEAFLNKKKVLHKKQYVQPGRSSLYFMRQGSAGEHANKIFRELDVNEDGELSIDEFVKGCLEDGELMMFTVRYLPLQWYFIVFKKKF